MTKTEKITAISLKTTEFLTYLDLFALFAIEQGWVGEKSESSSARGAKSRLKAWCLSQGVTLDSIAADTLGHGFIARLNRLCEELNASGKRSQERNIRWAATEVHRIYESLRVNQELPIDFISAIRAAMALAGLNVSQVMQQLNAKFGKHCRNGKVRNWLSGESHPYERTRKGSEPHIARLEEVLGLPQGTLLVRAFKKAHVFKMGNSQPIPYRDHQGVISKSKYVLKKMPEQLAPVWREIVYWHSQPVLRVRGEIYVREQGKIWTKSGTVDKYTRDVLTFVGWLCLPVASKPVHELTEAERWQTGKGLNPEDVTLADVLNADLVGEYLEFRRSRQVNKVYTQDYKHYIMLINALVNHPYSFVKAHDKLASLFGQSCGGAKWVSFVEKQLHLPILKVSRAIAKGIPDERQRSPDAPLKSIIADANPMVYLAELGDRMEADLAPAVHKQVFAAQLRDLTLIRMLTEIPLRSENIRTMTFGRHLERDAATGLWKLWIPKSELKNKSSPHAYDIDRFYSLKTSRTIDRYLAEGRTKLKGYDRTELVFLSGASGPQTKEGLKSNLPFREMNAQSLWHALSKRLKDYFGVGVGTNVFRHLNATSILKDNPGELHTAASVLNNSPDTIAASYKHLTQSDGLRRADAWRQTLDAKQEAMFGKRPLSA